MGAGWGNTVTEATPTPNPSPRHGEAMLRMDGEGNPVEPASQCVLRSFFAFAGYIFVCSPPECRRPLGTRRQFS
jgi:hypothetical protein